jgi:hypothetical protein
MTTASRTATPDMPPGISVLDTDLEVDFAAPKGYVEPMRPPPKPVETMASRLGLFPPEATKGGSKGGEEVENLHQPHLDRGVAWVLLLLS